MALILSCGGDFGTNEDCLWIEYQRKKKKKRKPKLWTNFQAIFMKDIRIRSMGRVTVGCVFNVKVLNFLFWKFSPNFYGQKQIVIGNWCQCQLFKVILWPNADA